MGQQGCTIWTYGSAADNGQSNPATDANTSLRLTVVLLEAVIAHRAQTWSETACPVSLFACSVLTSAAWRGNAYPVHMGRVPGHHMQNSYEMLTKEVRTLPV